MAEEGRNMLEVYHTLSLYLNYSAVVGVIYM